MFQVIRIRDNEKGVIDLPFMEKQLQVREH